MVNVFDYAYRRVKLVSDTGETYVGDVIDVTPAGEIEGEDKDSLSLEMDSGLIYGFTPDEIESITILE
ncbi:MAG: hypothetical protein IJK52_01690 [Oscillospiraceae bacterium]|nr:hypothetical protein [Oscillospiraceae bacterium]